MVDGDKDGYFVGIKFGLFEGIDVVGFRVGDKLVGRLLGLSDGRGDEGIIVGFGDGIIVVGVNDGFLEDG